MFSFSFRGSVTRATLLSNSNIKWKNHPDDDKIFAIHFVLQFFFIHFLVHCNQAWGMEPVELGRIEL